ncbi:hypothetical protein GCM10023085_75610 [Actinomadura viridis]|uniref:Uncharacterized protein n=1 Tax=Actinomadura viridis TaxID=58110 RepID=A0A931GKM2_9ACTN|nr:hypothetical protein [Actinomadura viridis]MBG6086556.1 hypothetical protein [Actinomadura viridis]
MTVDQAPAPASAWWPRIAGALLALAVAAVHVVDQGGFPGSKAPAYVGIGYYIVEVAAIVTAGLLIAGAVRIGWALAMAVAAGPVVGYVLSRGPGLPGYTDDIGNWTEPLGLASLAAEGLLFFLALTMLGRALAAERRAATGRVPTRAPHP